MLSRGILGYAAPQHLAGSMLNPGGAWGGDKQGREDSQQQQWPENKYSWCREKIQSGQREGRWQTGTSGRLAPLHDRGHPVTHGGPPPCTLWQGLASLPGPGADGETGVGDPQHHPQHPTPVPGRQALASPEGRGSSQLSSRLGRAGGTGELVCAGVLTQIAPTHTWGWLPCAPRTVRPPHHHTTPGASAGARTPTCMNPLPQGASWDTDPRPPASNGPNQLKLCRNHPHEFTEPHKSRAPRSCSPPCSELLKPLKALAR